MDFKIHYSPPTKIVLGAALDLEIMQMREPLHRPSGIFGCLSIATEQDVWIVRKETDIPKALSKVKGLHVFHYASFDCRHLRRWTSYPPRSGNDFWDTFMIEKLLWGGYYDSFELKDLARRYLKIRLDKNTRKEIANVTEMTDEMYVYAARDAWITWKVFQEQQKMMQSHPDQAWIENVREIWLNQDAPAFWAMLDFKGFPFNKARWLETAKINSRKASDIQQALKFNPGSYLQVEKALAEKGVILPDTREATLQAYGHLEVVRKILDYREAAKRASTYGEKFVETFVEPDGMIYAEFLPTIAETGRGACRSPNLQNQPREAEFRSCYKASPNHVLIIADYSQQEVRVAAEHSRDPEMLRAFESGEDIHLTAARAIYHDPKMTKDDPRRKIAKSLNLGLIYGLTAAGLASRTGLSLEECEILIARYFQRFSGLKRWMDGMRRLGAQREYTEAFGRLRIWVNHYSRQGSNNDINAPNQGGAAMITKRALRYMHEHWGAELPVVAVVHDEFVLHVPRRDATKTQKIVVECMERAFRELCPAVSLKGLVEVSVGKTWASKH